MLPENRSNEDEKYYSSRAVEKVEKALCRSRSEGERSDVG
jgi:hypothetical protein